MTTTQSQKSPAKVIVDTDPGVDDVLAILLSLASPELDVRLISIVFGNTHAPVAHSNLLKIYHALAQEIINSPEAAERYRMLEGQREKKTVLALGEDGPIGGEKAVAAYFHGPDGLSNISVTHPHFTPPKQDATDPHEHLEISSKPAYENILDVLREEEDGSVTIVALGPLTNIAHALRVDPKTFARVKSVVWMGGALDHPGNTSPVAEFNCFADPYAADSVLEAVKSGLFRIILAPLDITTPHQISFDDLIHPSYPSNPDPSLSPLKHLTSAMLGRVRGLQASFGLPDAMEMHDPVAVWYAIAHAHLPRGEEAAPGWAVKGRKFKVERNGELTRGMCVIDRRGGGGDGGNEAGETRTKNQDLSDNAVPESAAASTPAKRDRDGSEIKVEKSSDPSVIVTTPGSDELRRILLSRVFGTEL